MSGTTRLLVALALTLAAAPARAQSTAWTDRGYASADAVYRVTTSSFAGTAHPVDFAEPSEVDTTYRSPVAPGFDVGGGVRVWRSLAVGVDVSRFSKSATAGVSAQVPHPFFFGRPRPVSGSAASLTRHETAVHAQALWMILVSPRWQAAVFGGPSWFSVAQDLVRDVSISQTYPYDAAAFTGVVTDRASTSRIGFNVGADVTRLITHRVGLGVSAALSHARVRLAAGGSDAVSVDAGGAHVGGGIRFRF